MRTNFTRKVHELLRKRVGNFILLLSTMCLSYLSYGQGAEVNGTVTSSDDGEPLPGVNIVIKGTVTGSLTDVDGNYS